MIEVLYLYTGIPLQKLLCHVLGDVSDQIDENFS